jgi:hypothetical protein
VRDKKRRHAMVCERALQELDGWMAAREPIDHSKELSSRA